MRRAWLLLGPLLGYVGCLVPALEVDSATHSGGTSGEAGGSTAAGKGNGFGGEGEVSGAGTVESGGRAGSESTGGASGTAAGGSAGTRSDRGGAGGIANNGGAGGIGGAGGAAGAGGVAPATCPKAAGEICHDFLVSDNGRHNVLRVDEFSGGLIWTRAIVGSSADSPRTLELVDNATASGSKALLVSQEGGFTELDLKDGKVLQAVNTGLTGIVGAARMADGNTAVLLPAKVVIFSATGLKVREFTLPGAAADQVRGLKVDPSNGDFWLCKGDAVYNLASAGTQLWSATVGIGAKCTSVRRVEAGAGAYAATGDPSTIVQLDSAGTPVKTLGTKASFPSLDYTSGFVHLANGNFVAANWLGHLAAPPAATPQVVELTPNNKLVWQWGDQALTRNVTDVLVLR
jgi:hypothetical protein